MENNIEELFVEYENMILTGRESENEIFDQDIHVATYFDRQEFVRKIKAIGEKILSKTLKYLENNDPQVRKRAIIGLGILEELAIPTIQKALQDSDPNVRLQATNELKHIGEIAISQLMSAFKDDNAKIRREILEILADFRIEDVDFIINAFNDPDPKIRDMVLAYSVKGIGFQALKVPILALEDTDGEISKFARLYLTRGESVKDTLIFEWKDHNNDYLPSEIIASCISLIFNELIIRKVRGQNQKFNPKVISQTFEGLITQNPNLQGQILEQLGKIAFDNEEARSRAISVARHLGAEEFASLVKKRAAENPQTASQIMRELGGSEATAYFTETQSQTLAEYRAPLIDLEEMARQRWEELTLEAKRSSATSKWMSIGVFVVGTSIVVWAFILLSLSNEPWQQLAAALAGVGSFLALYSQRFWKEPVEQIQRFSAQQARLQIAFIGFMNRVAQIRLVFEDAYAKDKLPPETMAMYQQWLNEATDKAWQQLSDAASTVPSTTPNNEG